MTPIDPSATTATESNISHTTEEDPHAHALSYPLPVRVDIPIGIHHDGARKAEQAQEQEHIDLTQLSICAASPSQLQPNQRYAIRMTYASENYPDHVLWWNRATKREVIEGSNKRGPSGLIGPVTYQDGQEEKTIYAVKRMGGPMEVVRVKMIDDTTDEKEGREGGEAAILTVLP